MALENDSEFLPTQIDVCEVGPKEEKEKDKVCPTCIPDENFIPPEWWTMDKPFLNRKTCEYSIGVTINENGDTFMVGTIAAEVEEKGFEILKRSYIRPGIRMMLQYYGKMISDEIICALPPQESGDECGSTFDINFSDYVKTVEEPIDLKTTKVIAHSVPVLEDLDSPPVVGGFATNMDALEVYARTPEFRFTAQNNSGILQILVTVPAFVFDKVPEAPDLPEVDTSTEVLSMDAKDFYLAMNETIAALDVFSKYQAYFYQTENGNLFFVNSNTMDAFPTPFYLKNIVTRMKSFLSAFETLIENNGFRFGGGVSFLPKAHKIEITFDKSDLEKPFVIKRVRVKQKGCRWKKMKNGFKDPFLKKGSVRDQTTMGYVAVIDKIHPLLTARETPPWLDFTIEYTYPQLAIDYGSAGKFSDKRPDTCLSDVNAISNVILNNVLTFSDAFAYQLNKANCLSMYSSDYVFKATPSDFNVNDMELLARVPTFGFDAERFNAETFGGKSRYMKEYVLKKMKKQKITIVEENPVFKALSQFKTQFESDENVGDGLKTLMKMFNPCTFKDFSKTLLKCLFRGVDANTAYMSVIKSTLGNLAAEGLEIVLMALPADKQEEIRKKVEEEFADMPAPWEDGYKAGSLKTARVNRATEAKDRRLNAESGTLKLKNRIKEQFQKLKSAGFTGGIYISFEADSGDGDSSGVKEGYSITYSSYYEKGYSSKTVEPVGIESDTRLDVFKFKIEETPEKMNEYITNIAKYIPQDGDSVQEMKESLIKKNEEEFLVVKKEFEALQSKETRFTNIINSPDASNQEKNKATNSRFEIRNEMELVNIKLTDIAKNRQNLQNNNSTDLKIIHQRLMRTAVTALSKIEQMRDESITLQKDLEETQQYDNWNNLSEEEKAALIEAEANKNTFASLNPGDGYEEGTLGKALGNTQKAITKAYVDAIIEMAEIQQIMRAIDNLPGIKILGSLIATFDCPNTHFIFPPIDSFLSTLTFDPCGDEDTDLALPELEDIPTLSWSMLFDNLVNAFISALKITIKQAFTALFAKLAQLIDASLCKLLGFELPNVPSLMDVLGRSGCKESEILKAAGAAPPGRAPLPDEAYAQVAQTISNAGSEIQMKRALAGNPDRDYLRNIANSIQVNSPLFGDILGNPDALAEFFEAATGLMTPEQLLGIQQETDAAPILESPTNKCLTNDELAAAQENLNDALGALPDDILDDYNDQERDRTQDNIDQVLGIVLNGPNSVLSDILDQALQQNADPDCVDNINSVGAVLKKARETESYKNVKEGMFARVQKAFMDDMIKWNLFDPFDSPGVLSQILADKKGGSLNYYNWYRNVVSSLGALANIFPDPADLPTTIGISMREQFLLEKKWDQKITPKMNFRFEIEDEESEGGNFSSNIMIYDGGKDSFEHKIQVRSEEFSSFTIEAHEKVEEIHKKMIAELQPFTEQGGRYRSKMMLAFIKRTWSEFENTNFTLNNAENLIGSLNKAMFEKMMNRLVSDSKNGISQGFLYGHTPLDITSDDLKYVNPEPGSTEYTYEESAQVLGKSFTDNPRVQFLDPAQHGGTYSAPFYNILSEEKQGWSQFAKVIVSTIKGCDDVQSNFMFFQDIMDKMSEDESNIKPDDRLKLAPDCVDEKPFDKIANATTLSTLGGIVTAIIRMHVVDYMIRTFPINANVNMSFDKNHSKLISKLIVNRISDSLSNQTSLFASTYEGNVYLLLFLEQAVQLLKRKTDNADIEPDGALDDIFNTINEAQKAHVVPTYADIFGETKREDVALNVTIGSLIAAGGLFASTAATAVVAATGVLASAITLNQMKFAAKIGTIASVMDECKVALEYLVEEQLNFYSEMQAEVIEPRPYVHDISKFFIGSSNSMMKGNIRAGEVEIEAPTGGVSNFDYGSIPNCVHDIETEHPLSDINISSYDLMMDGGFFLEKYLRIEDKEITPAVISMQKIQLNRDFINNRDDKLKGVVNIENFKQFLSNNSDKIPADANISDFFGNAKIRLIDDGYNGSIGIKFGVRLCCVMPFRFEPFKTPSAEAANFALAQREKSYIFKNPPTEEARYAYPLCSFERDVPDNKLALYIDSDENFNQDLKCYVDLLCETPEFKLLFDHIVSTKRVPSIAATYSYLNFYSSLGKGEDEREDADDNVPVNLDRLFNDTRRELRRLFVSNYKRQDFDPPNEEDSEGGFVKDLAREALSKSVNNIFLGADIPWWMKARYKRKKVDEDGEVCGNQFGGLVNIAGGD
jgi:hypothetical protein